MDTSQWNSELYWQHAMHSPVSRTNNHSPNQDHPARTVMTIPFRNNTTNTFFFLLIFTPL